MTGWRLVVGVLLLLCVGASDARADPCVDDCDDYYRECQIWAWQQYHQAIGLVGWADAYVLYNRNRRACLVNAKRCRGWCPRGGAESGAGQELTSNPPAIHQQSARNPPAIHQQSARNPPATRQETTRKPIADFSAFSSCLRVEAQSERETSSQWRPS